MDAVLLAEVDTLHGTLSGPATKKPMERAFHVFGDARFERLAGISVAHLHNLRGSKLIRTSGGIGPRRGPPKCPLAPAAPRSPMAGPVTST